MEKRGKKQNLESKERKETPISSGVGWIRVLVQDKGLRIGAHFEWVFKVESYHATTGSVLSSRTSSAVLLASLVSMLLSEAAAASQSRDPAAA